MKIGIITLSASDNCGSLLQTYALMNILKEKGHTVEIIDFSTRISKKMYRIFHPGYLNEPKKFWGQFFLMRKLINQKKAYQSFRDNYLDMSKNKYYSSKDLELLDGKYDIVVCGSDQIWNVYMRDFDNAFLLNWCKKSKCISYAASLGDQKNGNLVDLVNEGLDVNKFAAISVREKSAVIKFEKELNQKVDKCLDPTLLLSKSQWEELIGNKKRKLGKYIFYYSYNYNNEAKNKCVSDFAKKTGLPVYVINASKWVDGKNKNYGFQLYDYEGPLAFLELMANCEFAMVESFHGCIFSFIFEKNFWFIEDKKTLDDRINDLLETIELKNRVIYINETKNYDNSQIDYKNKKILLANEIRKSNNFLNSFINDK